jgi:hypothetical protein
MPRKANEGRVREAQQVIRKSPGEKSGYYANQLGMHRYDFNTLLAMLNDRHFHLWEDDDGRLWLFDPDQT